MKISPGGNTSQGEQTITPGEIVTCGGNIVFVQIQLPPTIDPVVQPFSPRIIGGEGKHPGGEIERIAVWVQRHDRNKHPPRFTEAMVKKSKKSSKRMRQ